jgi:SnoaL-like domain
VSQAAVWHCYIPTGSYARTVSIAIGRSASNYIMKRRTNHDKHRRVAQESACNGSLRTCAAWEKKDWGPVDSLFADNFTFTSAAGVDHISKSTFKARCWETQIDFIGHFDLERITTGAEDAFVKYLCHTKDGKSFRNVEYLRIKNGKLQSIECYFGAQSSFPSAVSTGQK